MAGQDVSAFNVTVVALERLRNSRDGNPRYRVTFDSGLVAETQSNASFNYEIGNPEWRDVPVIVVMTPSGRIKWFHHVPA